MKKIYYQLSALSLLFIAYAVYASGENNLPPLILSVRYTVLALYANLFTAYCLFIRSAKADREKPSAWLGFAAVLAVLALIRPVFSGDLMEYLVRGRILGLYHKSPYVYLPLDFPDDPLRVYSVWAKNPDSYGPLSVYLQTLPVLLFRDSLTGMIWSYKMIVLLFFAVAVFYFWKITERLGLKDAPRLWATFAYCPLVVIIGFIDGHNDVIMMALSVVSMYHFLAKRYTRAFIFWTAGFLIKYMNVIYLPFMVVWAAKDRWKESGRFPVGFIVKETLINAALIAAFFAPVWGGQKTFLAIFRQMSAFYTDTVPYLFHRVLLRLGIAPDATVIKYTFMIGFFVFYAALFCRFCFLKEARPSVFFKMISLAYLAFYVSLTSTWGYWYLTWALPWIILAEWPQPLLLET